MNTDVTIEKKAGTYTSLSPQEGKQYGHATQNLRYNSSRSHVVNDYVKHGKYACKNGRKS